VGALVHRSGQVDYVIVGHATGLMLPDIGRLRAAQGRFRALRLVHTHLFNEALTRDDLVDLKRLRLDLVARCCSGPTASPRIPGPTTPAAELPPYRRQTSARTSSTSISASSCVLEASLRAPKTRAVAGDGRAILVLVGEKSKAPPRATSKSASRVQSSRTAG
jgi:GTP-binding protein HflX